MKAFDGTGGFGGGDELHVELLQLLDDARSCERTCAEGEVGPAGAGGEFPENAGFELGLDHVAGSVANVVAPGIGVGVGNETATLGADADGDDEDVLLERTLDHGLDAGLGIAAVAEEDEAVSAGRGFLKGLNGEIQCVGEDGAAFGNGIEIERLDGLRHGVVIGRERRLKVGVSGEGNESDTITRHQRQQILCSERGAGEAIGREVVGQHAAGGVDRDDDIPSALGPLDFFLAPARLGEGDDEKSEGEDLKSENHPAKGRTGTGNEGVAQAG